MSILNQLSSQVGDRTEQSNLEVVALCLDQPALLAEIAAGLTRNEAALLGDCTEAVASYARTGSQAAQAAYPILLEALTVWNEKHAGRALNGLSHVAAAAPELADELHAVGLRYHDHGRGVVRKTAKRLLRTIESL